MRIVILDGRAADQGDDAFWAPVRQWGDVDLHRRTAPSEVIARCQAADAVLTNKTPLSAEVLAHLPALRYIGVTATGTNIVDLAVARQRQVTVTNVPGYSTASVAQHVIGLLLHTTNDVAALSTAAKDGRWTDSADFCYFRKPLVELAGKTLVVVGMGAIGSATARIASSFGMRILAAQVPGSATPGRVPLAEAVHEADVVTLHCPLTAQTTELVNDAFLADIKPGAVLINTGRGGLLDVQAIIRALASGRLASIALDVLDSEPPPADHPLLSRDAAWSDRVVVTPHVAWGTVEARRRLVVEVARNLQSFLDGKARNRVA